mgnify:CR=1 FL=1
MATMLCKEAGVETVIVKCANEMHKKILTKIGADTVVFPESESGRRLAKNLLSSGFAEMIELSDAVSMVDLDVREEWVGKSLIELNLRKRFAINIVAIRKNDKVKKGIDDVCLDAGEVEVFDQVTLGNARFAELIGGV